MSTLEIRAWFNDGKKKDDTTFMIVVHDNLNALDYPIFTDSEPLNHAISEVNRAPMQRLVEVYDLNEDRDTQLAEVRCWRVPSDPDPGRISAGD